MSYAEEEISLKLEKAKLEASIEMLNYKKETAAAIAEAEALEAAVDANRERHSFVLALDSSSLEAAQRTEQYVIDQAKSQNTDAQLLDDGLVTKREPNPVYRTPASTSKSEDNPCHLAQAHTASHNTHGHNAASQPTPPLRFQRPVQRCVAQRRAVDWI